MSCPLPKREGSIPETLRVPPKGDGMLSIPMGVACTTRSKLTSSSARPTLATDGANAAALQAAAGVRLTTTTSAAPALASPSTAARAAPPAPMTPHRRSTGSKPAPSRKSSISPSPSVLSAKIPFSSNTSVLAAPRRREIGDRRVASLAAAFLCGIVTESPRMPSAAAPAIAASKSAGETSNAS